jgi:hypothetical protein
LVEGGEEVISYGGDITGVKTSCWETGEGSIEVEATEKTMSRFGDIAGIETSRWQAGQ